MTKFALPPQTFFPDAAIWTDDDPRETREWIEAPEGVARSEGRKPT